MAIPGADRKWRRKNDIKREKTRIKEKTKGLIFISDKKA